MQGPGGEEDRWETVARKQTWPDEQTVREGAREKGATVSRRKIVRLSAYSTHARHGEKSPRAGRLGGRVWAVVGVVAWVAEPGGKRVL